MASTTTAADIPLIITSPNASSERRVSPSWTISHFKSRLEPITGIPTSAQSLRLGSQAIQAADEDSALLSGYALQPYAEIHVTDNRPKAMQTNFNDVSLVEKYEMPPEEYESRKDSVLAWKKAQKLGRFDPNAASVEEQKIQAQEREIEERGITPNSRCRLLPASDSRRGKIAYIGPVPPIPGLGAWIGIALDEPTGKNDGSVRGERFFQCPPNCGVFVRPERVEVGDFAVLDDLGDDEDMEEM